MPAQFERTTLAGLLLFVTLTAFLAHDNGFLGLIDLTNGVV
jgi:hypothetical protein